MNNMDYVKVGKKISYILRHHPEEFGLELDEEGWIDYNLLLKVLDQQCPGITIEDIYTIMAKSDKKRYEIKDGKIRAYYGHTFKKKIQKTSSKPPVYLYHGTARRFLPMIMQKGLLPMQRQYVHLSSDEETALKVGSRRDKHPIILKINAQEAYLDGIHFYEGNEQVWLADPIPMKYIENSDDKGI